MFYFKFHIGDYRRETQHLTLLEHGVYMSLMSTYYTNEKPLPKDERQLFRLAGARTDDEKQAVLDIVNEFFKPTETHWVHSRIDFELSEYHAKAEVNRENGKKGGRPRKNQDKNPNGFNSVEEKTQTVSEPKPNSNPEITLTNKPINPLTQEPIINIDSDKPKSFNFKKALVDGGVSSDSAIEFISIRKLKKARNTENAFKSLMSEVNKSGLTLSQAIDYCIQRQSPWGAFKNEWYLNEQKSSNRNTGYQNAQQATASEHDKWQQAFNQQSSTIDVTPVNQWDGFLLNEKH